MRREDSEEYARYQKALDGKRIMFEEDKNLKIDLSSVSIEEFLNKLSD